MRKPTIQDVAKHAGVGVGTVSRVLNNHSTVKSTTRAAILRAIDELDYIPNPHARRIAGGKSYTMSIILPFLTTEFYTRLLNGLEKAFQEARYDMALFPLIDLARLERYLGSHTLAYQADGLVMATYNLTTLLSQPQLKFQPPTVLVDAYSENVDCAYLDNVKGGQLAGEYAARLPGQLYAIWIETEFDHLFTTRVFDDRRMGFLAGLNAAKRNLNIELVTSLDFISIRKIVTQLLDVVKLPCTVFASADLVAGNLLDEVTARRLKPGVDVRIIGFDDQPWSEARGLTTVHQPVEIMAYEAAQLLLSRLKGYTGPPRAQRFKPKIILRTTA